MIRQTTEQNGGIGLDTLQREFDFSGGYIKTRVWVT
jgi:hypothetical protein